ncbi:hypothetical protein PINS_up008192 [Pythium insidiosum]|nr:hypothetical protein PINS_up008192 [Pythium insidiosum]
MAPQLDTPAQRSKSSVPSFVPIDTPSWQDVVYIQPLALSVHRSNDEPYPIKDITLHRHPQKRNWNSYPYLFVHVFQHGEYIERIDVFSAVDFVFGFRMITNLGAQLVVGKVDRLDTTKTSFTSTPERVISNVKLVKVSDDSRQVTVGYTPVSWMRPLVSSDAVQKHSTAGTVSSSASEFEIYCGNVAAVLFDLRPYSNAYLQAIHVVNKEELGRIKALTAKTNQHFFILEQNEEITGADILYSQERVQGMRIRTSQRVSSWYGQQPCAATHASLTCGSRGRRVCGIHGTASAFGINTIGFLSEM